MMRLTLFAVFFCFAVSCFACGKSDEECTTVATTHTRNRTSQAPSPTPLIEPGPGPDVNMTTTVTSTITQTSTTIHTNTRAVPCPPVSTGVLSFDDLSTRGVSPMPLTYQNFTFCPGWQYYTYNSSSPDTPQYRGVPESSRPNALITRSNGSLSISAVDWSFSFDLISAQVFAFTNDGAGESVHLQFELIHRDGEVQSLWREAENGFAAGREPTLVEFAKGFGRWVDLTEVKLAAWERFDNSTGVGKEAVLILDDVKFQKRVC